MLDAQGDRHLVCGRCLLQWRFAAITCPFCLNDDRARITSFGTSDGLYRVNGCDACHRYVKAFDARRATELGFKAESSFEEIIRAHIEDELGGRIGG
jgi:formate dehydrogenase maturation protein FdhE